MGSYREFHVGPYVVIKGFPTHMVEDYRRLCYKCNTRHQSKFCPACGGPTEMTESKRDIHYMDILGDDYEDHFYDIDTSKIKGLVLS